MESNDKAMLTNIVTAIDDMVARDELDMTNISLEEMKTLVVGLARRLRAEQGDETFVCTM